MVVYLELSTVLSKRLRRGLHIVFIKDLTPALLNMCFSELTQAQTSSFSARGPVRRGNVFLIFLLEVIKDVETSQALVPLAE